MKKTMIAIAILLAANTCTFAQTNNHGSHKHGETATKYTCTMHPEVVKNKPGKCPKCDMTLVKMKPQKKDSKMKGDMKGMKM